MTGFVDRRDIETERPLDFTRVSEGFKAPGSITGKVMSAQGELLGDMGKTIATGLNAFDEALGDVARNVAKDEVSKLYAAEGIDDGRLPPALVKEIQGLKDMKEAADAGSIDTAGFNVKLLAATKRLKTAWSGHQDYIDKGLREMGFTPAADVKADRVAAAKAAKQAADDASKREASFQDWAVKNAPNAVLEWQAGGMKNGAAGLRAVVLKHNAQEENLKLKGQVLDIEIKNGNISKQRVEGHLATVANAVIERTFSTVAGEYAHLAEATKKFNEGIAKGEHSPGELQAIMAQTTELKRKTMETLALTLMKTPGYNVDSDVSKKVLANAEATVDAFISSIMGKDPTTGGLIKAVNEANVAGKQFDSFKDPAVLHMYNIKQTWGETYLNEVWRPGNSKVATAVDRALSADQIFLAANGGAGGLKEGFEKLQREGVKDPAAYAEILQHSLGALKHPSVPIQTKYNIFNYLYSDKNIGMVKLLDEKDQVALFAQLSNPENFKAAQELAVKMNDKKLVDRYKKMTVTSFADMNEQTGPALNNIIKKNEHSFLYINPTTLQLTVGALQQPVAGQNSSTAANLIVGALNAVDQKAVDRFNTTFAALIPVFEANGLNKHQMITEMNKILQGMGVDLNDQVKEKPASREFLDLIGEKVWGAGKTLKDKGGSGLVD